MRTEIRKIDEYSLRIVRQISALGKISDVPYVCTIDHPHNSWISFGDFSKDFEKLNSKEEVEKFIKKNPSEALNPTS